MTIETKYDIGQKVWGSQNGKPVNFTIARIYIKVHQVSGIRISYEYDDTNDDRMYRLPEYMVFPTKKELLKSYSYGKI